MQDAHTNVWVTVILEYILNILFKKDDICLQNDGIVY